MNLRRLAASSFAVGALAMLTMAPASATTSTTDLAPANAPPISCASAIAAAVDTANSATAAAANVADSAAAAAAAKAFAEGVLTGAPAAINDAAANLGAFSTAAATAAAASAAAHATAATATIGVLVACAKA
ncbi:hypothetical protein DMH03_25710 [Amycolatopsis sp. WAC 01376]|nr:hypothetical protein DMH03_25710 [Amycolatopsis sp. WAC 01376]